MKIVTLLGSPRADSHSSAIAQRLNDTAAQLGADTQTFALNKMSYRGCQGCYACKTPLDHCAVKDDLSEALEAVRNADALVLTTPVYYGDVTAQLKGFIDRTFAYLKPDFLTNPAPSRLAPKKLVFIITQGHPDENLYADIYQRNATCFTAIGFTEIHLIRACGVGPGTTIPEAVMQQAEATARALMS
ncbi:flavodoxin family protein [Geomesophilobacter sediminis]|uniref:Flavodoxin family protein n=1 Tax=Geomesophilobacter sediminis TaxID=2798584 RepID=A0A8J7M121_9BACT|nr:flavodoxin family protein [Geomesophilobacter sediminis]MBJ6726675.1 flavodoxin family protein [Geomesophilobacter sediminis]